MTLHREVEPLGQGSAAGRALPERGDERLALAQVGGDDVAGLEDVAGCAAVSLVVYLTMRETRDIDLGRVGAADPKTGQATEPSGATSVTPAS